MFKQIAATSISIALTLGMSSVAHAGSAPLNGILGGGIWDGWTQFADDDGETDPGVGGQKFDTEYFFYKRTGNVLEIGLQAGFDLVDGDVLYGGKWYYGGDLALSFDGDLDYEYGVDVNNYTEDYYGAKVDMGTGTGIDAAGLYEVTSWDLDVYTGHVSSNPFAIDGGNIVAGGLIGIDEGSAFVGGHKSYFSKVSLDITAFGYGAHDPLDVNAHWTMSCGNDEINGNFISTSVPAPAGIALVLLGLMGLGFRKIA